MIDDLTNNKAVTNTFHQQIQFDDIKTNTNNHNQNLENNLQIINQQQSPNFNFIANTNVINKFQDQQIQLTIKPVCAFVGIW